MLTREGSSIDRRRRGSNGAVYDFGFGVFNVRLLAQGRRESLEFGAVLHCDNGAPAARHAYEAAAREPGGQLHCALCELALRRVSIRHEHDDEAVLHLARLRPVHVNKLLP